MNDQDFTTSVVVDASPLEAFNAVVDPRRWWGTEIEGRTDRIGDEWTYRYKDMHVSRQRTVDLDPGKRVVWHVVDATMNFLEDKSEWRGTDLVFDIAQEDGKTEIRFTHKGLKPSAECFGMCSNAWTGLIGNSLRNLVETGRGEPDDVE
jgi:uncharacterized protein YndB with AHSA1/START domain